MEKKLVILVGPSQSGKTTLMKKLLQNHPEVKRLITCTTRAPRKDEIDGIERNFVDEKEFEDKENFLEWTVVHGNYYGSRKSDLDKNLKASDIIVMDIDIKGIAHLLKNKEKIPAKIVTVFLSPPKEILLKRIQKKQDVNLNKRIESMENELKFVKEHDYFDYFLDTSKTEKESLEELEAVVLENNKDILKKLKIKPKFLV